jgi:hypothetical protein
MIDLWWEREYNQGGQVNRYCTTDENFKAAFPDWGKPYVPELPKSMTTPKKESAGPPKMVPTFILKGTNLRFIVPEGAKLNPGTVVTMVSEDELHREAKLVSERMMAGTAKSMAVPGGIEFDIHEIMKVYGMAKER